MHNNNKINELCLEKMKMIMSLLISNHSHLTVDNEKSNTQNIALSLTDNEFILHAYADTVERVTLYHDDINSKNVKIELSFATSTIGEKVVISYDNKAQFTYCFSQIFSLLSIKRCDIRNLFDELIAQKNKFMEFSLVGVSTIYTHSSYMNMKTMNA